MNTPNNSPTRNQNGVTDTAKFIISVLNLFEADVKTWKSIDTEHPYSDAFSRGRRNSTGSSNFGVYGERKIFRTKSDLQINEEQKRKASIVEGYMNIVRNNPQIMRAMPDSVLNYNLNLHFEPIERRVAPAINSPQRVISPRGRRPNYNRTFKVPKWPRYKKRH